MNLIMSEPALQSENEATKRRFFDFFLRTGPAIFLSLVLFAGGVALLALRLPGWSLLFGLPATQIGIIFLILTFDDVFKKRLDPRELILKKCRLCQNPTAIIQNHENSAVCAECRERIIDQLKGKRV